MQERLKQYTAEFRNLVPPALGVLIGLIAVGAGAFLGKSLFLYDFDPSDVLAALSLVVLTVTVVVAVHTHRKTIEFSKSREYLDTATELVNRAREVLSDSEGAVSNDRIKWVTAARLITRALNVAELITVDAHRKIFEVEHDYQRHLFEDFMKLNGESLSPSFFLGAEYEGLSLGAAAHHSTQAKHGDLWIPARIVSVVYRFFQYPEDYTDPLKAAQELDEKEMTRLWLLGQSGAHDYLTFRKHFARAGGTVFRTVKGGKSRPMSAAQIDTEMSQISQYF